MQGSTSRQDKSITLAGLATLVAMSGLVGCHDPPPGPYATARAAAPPRSHSRPEEHLEVPPPPFSEGIYPCTDCHADMEVNRKRRKLTEEHGNIVLRHDDRWCLDCHDPDNRDYLHLASGELVPFKESYKLCGQCHGDKYRDWKACVHGRRTGYWDGPKKYLLCVHCHDPHQPRFKPIAPEPPPRRPIPGIQAISSARRR